MKKARKQLPEPSRTCITTSPVWVGSQPGSVGPEPPHVDDRGSAEWESSSFVRTGKGASGRARRGKKTDGCSNGYGSKPAAIGPLRAYGPRGATHARGRLQQHVSNHSESRLRHNPCRDAP